MTTDPYANREDVPYFNAKEHLTPSSKKLEPQADALVSKIVGHKVLAQDPRLIRLIVKWKQESSKPDNSTAPDNYLKDPKKVKELIETLNKPL